MRRSWKRAGLAAALLLVVAGTAAGIWLYRGYAATIDVEDREQLLAAAQACWPEEEVAVVLEQARGDYYGALCQAQGDDGQRLLLLRRAGWPWQDRYVVDGTASTTRDISSYRLLDPEKGLVVVYGDGRSSGAEGYCFLCDGTTYSRPLTGDYVVDIFVLPGAQGSASHPILLEHMAEPGV